MKVAFLFLFGMIGISVKILASDGMMKSKGLIKKEIKAITVKNSKGKFPPIYIWGYMNGDPCAHLFCIHEDSYIDDTGMSQPTVTITLMNGYNFEGTSTICPEEGSYFV
jgi:hypothetical protein